ncbi:hypothetical protein BRADI_1g14140v3 [Brachypodium distachyon]|uniref:G protein gamma domain-containing protein n=1 Tax=Brachypodium distachyon TaxID=15368 RepID=A0A2K2DJF0_BRADI|nr:hypothetical protein BRADI_1g14140v3 [Brachypodium distachyon]
MGKCGKPCFIICAMCDPIPIFQSHWREKSVLDQRDFRKGEELQELEKTDIISAALQEFLVTIEGKADPLLPVTTGVAYQSWDRWFEGPEDLRRCKCWCL